MTATHFVLTETEVVDMFLRPGWVTEERAGEGERARREVRTHLDRWCAAGMPFRMRDGVRLFDPVDLNFVTTRGLTGADPFLGERVTPFWRAAASEHAPRAVPDEQFHDPRRVSLTIRRELSMAGRAPGTKVLVSLPVPVEEPTQQQLVVTPLPLADGSAVVKDGLLVVRTTVAADGRVRFGARIDFVGYQQTVAVDPAQLRADPSSDPSVASYLAPEEGIIRISPKLEALARRLTRDNPWETLLAFWEHVFDTKKIGAFYYHELDEEDPLGSAGEWVDCRVGSALLVALARAAGIPSRMVRGVLMYPPMNMAHHYWAEMYLPPYGWVPLDLYGWALAAGQSRDVRWSRHLVGHLPYQPVVQRLPSAQLEIGAVYPRRWYAVSKMSGTGQEDTTYDLDSGSFVKKDDYEATIGARLSSPT